MSFFSTSLDFSVYTKYYTLSQNGQNINGHIDVLVVFQKNKPYGRVSVVLREDYTSLSAIVFIF